MHFVRFLHHHLREMERRWLRPLGRKFRRSRYQVGMAARPSAAVEQLAVALVRTELRRRSQAAVRGEQTGDAWPALVAFSGHRPSDLEMLVRSLIMAAPVTGAAEEVRFPRLFDVAPGPKTPAESVVPQGFAETRKAG